MTMRTLMILAIGGILISGCRSNPQGQFNIAKRQITINTEPEGATVTQFHPTGMPSNNLGVTPIIDQPVVVVTDIVGMKNLPPEESMDMLRRAGGQVQVVIHKDGYEPFKGYLKTEADQTAVHQITLRPKQ